MSRSIWQSRLRVARLCWGTSVPSPLRVLYFTGETRGQARAKLLRRIAQGKQLSAEQRQLVRENLVVIDRVPALATEEGLLALEDVITDLQSRGWSPELVIIDPAYIAIGGDTDMSRINHVGGVVLKADELVRRFGATLLLCWHYSKEAQRRLAEAREPAILSDLTGAGAASAARQWVLLSPFSPYDPGTGKTTLWLNAGIATTTSQTYLIDIDEGAYVPDHADGLNGRRWQVKVRAGARAFEAAEEAKTLERVAKAGENRDSSSRS